MTACAAVLGRVERHAGVGRPRVADIGAARALALVTKAEHVAVLVTRARRLAAATLRILVELQLAAVRGIHVAVTEVSTAHAFPVGASALVRRLAFMDQRAQG